MAAVRKSLILLCLCSFASAAIAAPDVDALVASMARAYAENRTRLRAYVLTRNYAVFKSGEQKSKITAVIVNLPPHFKTFEIQNSTGGRAEGVVRKALEKEMQIARGFQNVDVNASNYVFELLGEEPMAGAPCYVLAIHPKRKSGDLLEGKIWLDKGLYLIRRVQGRPMKSPSWWVKNVSLTLDYGNLEGMWLQIGSTAEANVRFAGEYRLVSRKVGFTLLASE